MNQSLKRVLNAFILGSLSAAILLILDDFENISNALRAGDWASLRVLGTSLLFGIVVAGLRTIQSMVRVVPSPEPEENSPRTR